MKVVEAQGVTLYDMEPPVADVRRAVHEGLSQESKSLPCKLLYDEVGAALFARITALPEYYPTRTETWILETHGAAMAAGVGPEVRLVEFGAGYGTKTRLLLSALERPASYVPIDISREALLEGAAVVNADHRDLVVQPMCADYTRPFALPPEKVPSRATVAWFPGSTIGNFLLAEATAFLGQVADTLGPGGVLLLGTDLRKDPALLHAAYDDREGITAAFNANILVRIRDELGGDLDVDGFRHEARYVAAEHRIEMHLVSQRAQAIILDGVTYAFRAGETIHTESSCKYDRPTVEALARAAGFRLEAWFSDPQEWFAVSLLRVQPPLRTAGSQ